MYHHFNSDHSYNQLVELYYETLYFNMEDEH